ncbi:MAG TPA: hypothetical protein VF515_07325 [Candidatus Binatia bacterium]|jgi:hypothetical protein
MMRIGDEVVVMSTPGRFRVVAVDDSVVTIESAKGLRKTVREQNARLVAKRDQTSK